MTNAVTALTTTLSADAVWGVFAQAIPFIGVVVLVAVGATIIYKQLKKLKKMR